MLVIAMGILLVVLGYVLGIYFIDSGEAGVILALIVWVILNLVAYFQGDSILLSLSKARKISKDDHPRLYNVVEEMKIASGLPKMPDVYIIDDPAMNAFATGRDANTASIAVTSGLLQNLNRDELQGVVAHELAHINNRDVLLMAMCSVLLGTIVILSWYASRFLFFGGMGRSRRSSSSGGGSAQLIILVVAIVLMILAPIFAQLIYFAVSRKREYLADACSALYTRYPEGLASALEKLAASPNQLQTATNATAPMYTINPFRKKGMAASDFTSTHPPISERIRILRSMGGASYGDYDKAYQQVKKSHSSLISTADVAASGLVPLRGPSEDTKEKETVEQQIERKRETSDAVWNSYDYKTIDCDCGTRLRVPPSFRNTMVKCPHCGRLHTV